jgi:hypothetical protein
MGCPELLNGFPILRVPAWETQPNIAFSRPPWLNFVRAFLRVRWYYVQTESTFY